MAYPIKIFDLQTEDGRKTGFEFLKKFDKNLTEIFGTVKKQDTQRQLHRWKEGEIPSYLTDLAIKAVQDVLKQLPQGEMKWRGSVGIYGRKTGSIIKREKDLLYRIVINLGDIEIYHLDGDDFNGEPVVLPNGYALLCSPVMIDRADIKVQKDPIRKSMDPKFIGMVPKIRGKDYLRSTIVLDLLMDGLNISNLKEASVPKEEITEAETLTGPRSEQGLNDAQ